jgi:hypothetical protein
MMAIIPLERATRAKFVTGQIVVRRESGKMTDVDYGSLAVLAGVGFLQEHGVQLEYSRGDWCRMGASFSPSSLCVTPLPWTVYA